MLRVDARLCGERVKANLFEAGMTLVRIGLGRVTIENVKEVQFRLDLTETIYGPSLFTAQELVGIEINSEDVPFKKWIGRIYDNLFPRKRRAKK